MWSDQVTAGLRRAFEAADYSVDGVLAAIGPEAHLALGRNSAQPAVRALAGRDDPLATLSRLWPLQRPVTRAAADRALPGLVEPLLAAGVLTTDEDVVTAAIDIRPYARPTRRPSGSSPTSPRAWTPSPRRSGRTSCSACRRPRPRWPS